MDTLLWSVSLNCKQRLLLLLLLLLLYLYDELDGRASIRSTAARKTVM